MIKVKQNTLEPDRTLKLNNAFTFNSNELCKKDLEEKEVENFATDDFLGINRKFKLVNENNKPAINSLTAQTYIKNSLQKIFNNNIAFWPDETLIHPEILNLIIKENDLIVLDDLVNPTLRLAVMQLHRNNIFIIRHNNLEKLDDLAKSHTKTKSNIWYVAQSIYPVPGSKLPLKKINKLLENYNRLFCYVDESYSLSWTGKKGKGLFSGNIDHPERLVLTASLTKGFGANAGAVAVSNQPGLSPALAGQDGCNNIQSIMYAADLHGSEELNLLQLQLQNNINYYHSLIDGRLPCKSDRELPISFIAGGLPEICHEICSEMLKEGFYVSSAIFPHASIKQPGIKININASQTKKHIKEMTEVLKEAYHTALKKRNKTLTDLLKNKN